MNITALLGIIITALLLGTVLKQYKSEYAIGISVVAGVIIALRLISGMIQPIARLWQMLENAGIKQSYFTAALKALGICLLCGFVSDLCKDFGQTALSSFTLTAGKCAVFIISVPILLDLLQTAYKFIG